MRLYPILFLLLLFQLPAIAISIIIPSEPAPMGIGYYGVNPDNSTYSLNITAWLGIITIYNLSATNSFQSQPYTVSFQLNTVLHYEEEGKNYALWIQNVAFYNTETHEVWFEDAIWNFSLPPAQLFVEGNGVVSYENGQYFYSYCPSDEVNLTLPTSIYLMVNVSTQNQTVLHFYYNDGHGGWVNYDNVIVEVQNISNVYFLVNGSESPPTGHYYATCLIMGGYAYSSTAMVNEANVTMQLFYWNGHNWQEGVSAYNFGAITGERVGNVVDKFTFVNGEPIAVITSGSGNAGWLWTEKNVSTLTIHTNVKSGYVLLFNSSIPSAIQKGEYLNVSFVNNLVNLTLKPSSYTVLLYNSSGEIVGKTRVNLAGSSVAITINGESTQSQTSTSTSSSSTSTQSTQNTTSSTTISQSTETTTENQSTTTQEHSKTLISLTSTLISESTQQQGQLTISLNYLLVAVAVLIFILLVMLLLMRRKR